MPVKTRLCTGLMGHTQEGRGISQNPTLKDWNFQEDWQRIQAKKLIPFIKWQGKSKHSDWSFLGRDFAIRTVSMEMVISCIFFAFELP